MLFRKKSETEWQPERISKVGRRELKNFKNRNMKSRGVRDGRKNLPEDSPKDNPKYSNTESDIFSFAKRRFEELCQNYENSKENLLNSIDNQYRIDVLAPEYESDFLVNVQGQIDTEFTEQSVKLHILAKDELRSNKDLRAFKAHNDLEESAKPAKPFAWIIVIILAYLLGESMFNMFIFQDISEAGLTGGFVLAAGCSAANIIMGFFCGFGGRLMIHISLIRKIIGISISALMIGLASLWNLFIAHFREVIIAYYDKIESELNINIGDFSMFEAGKTALENLLVNYVKGIGDLTSYLLLLIGITVFIFIAWKTYNQFWDPYIGYSRAQGKADKATQTWQEAKNNTVARIKDIVKKHKRDWANQVADATQKVNRVQEAGNTLVAHRSDIVGEIETTKRDMNRALQIYRENNSYVRDVRPRHFENLVEFEVMKPKTAQNEDKETLADKNFLPTTMITKKLDKLNSNLAKNETIFASMTRKVNKIQTTYLDGIEKKFDAIYAKETANISNATQETDSTKQTLTP